MSGPSVEMRRWPSSGLGAQQVEEFGPPHAGRRQRSRDVPRTGATTGLLTDVGLVVDMSSRNLLARSGRCLRAA